MRAYFLILKTIAASAFKDCFSFGGTTSFLSFLFKDAAFCRNPLILTKLFVEIA